MTDLKKLFGKKYRIKYEETLQKKQKKLPEFSQIICKFGHIYIHGENWLGISLDGYHPKMRNKLINHPQIHLTQDGDDGMNAIFEIKTEDNRISKESQPLLKFVFNIIKPKIKRKISLKEKERLSEQLRRYRQKTQFVL